MSNSEGETFLLVVNTVNAQGAIDYDTRLTLFDGDDRQVAQSQGVLELGLVPGLYVVRAERAGSFHEELIRHVGETRKELGSPKRFSAVPTSDVHVTDPEDVTRAEHWSKKETTDPIGTGSEASGRLFLYIREHSAYRPVAVRPSSVAETLSLHRLDGRLVTQLPSTVLETGPNWAVFNAKVPPGLYVLRRNDDRPRTMAIWVYANWTTQVFMLHSGQPDFASTSILLAEVEEGFSADDHIARITDTAVQGLVNMRATVPKDDVTDLLLGKFRNPMFGLLGAHLALRTERPFLDLSQVISNLERLIGDVPDVRALRIALARDRGESIDEEPFTEPPGLDAGFQAIVDATSDWPELVPPESPLGQIALHRLSDSTWTSWEPYFHDKYFSRIQEPIEGETPEWVNNYLEDLILQSARRGDEEVDMASLVAQTKLPVSSIAQAYASLRAREDPGFERTLAMEQIISWARRSAGFPTFRDPGDLIDHFRNGEVGERVEILGWMQGNKSLRRFEVVLEGIIDSRSAFEQYHALRLADVMLDDLDDADRRRLWDALDEQRQPDGWIGVNRGGDRWELSRRLLYRLGQKLP